MEPEQGTEETLQETTETPVEETEATLTDEQKEELAVAEEVKKLVTDKDPPGFQKRIDQAIRKFRTEERARIKAEKEGTESKAVIEEMRKHNEKLYKAIQRQTNAVEAQTDTLTDRTKQDTVALEINNIQNRIAYLKSERIKAREEMDWKRDSTLEDQLDSLKEMLISKHNEAKQQKPNIDASEKREREATTEWIENTPWFLEFVDGKPNPHYDEDMADFAMGKDKRMSESQKWKGIPIEARLAEVKKVTEEHFKMKGITKTVSPESTKGLPPPRKSSLLELTDDERTVISKMFPNLPKVEAERIYAEQKRFIGGK